MVTATNEKAAEIEKAEAGAIAPRGIIELMALVRRKAGALAPASSGGVPFPFRGVDAVINHLEPILDEYGVLTIPTVLQEKTTERPAGSKVVKTTRVKVRFDFYAPDGSSIAATTVGLADDYADRSAAQAQSVAFRIALLQSFTLPTQSPDPEVTGGQAQEARESAPAPAAAKKPTVVDTLRAEILAIIKDENNPYTGDMVNEIGDKETGLERTKWFGDAKALEKVVGALRSGVTV